jgi:pyrroline-5-carboxylate reductase
MQSDLSESTPFNNEEGSCADTIDPCRVLIIGGGRMGGALAKRWSCDPHWQIYMVSPHCVEQDWGDSQFERYSHVSMLPPAMRFDVIVIAIKPQAFSLLTDYIDYFLPGSVVVSIAAGQSCAHVKYYSPDASYWVRAMPNLAVSIGQGAVAAFSPYELPVRIQLFVTRLLNGCGTVYWLDKEELFDATTALLGSGPAFIFYVMELFMKTGEELGLPKELAHDFTVETIHACALLATKSHLSCTALREHVTSPGGTTAAGLNEWMNSNFLQSLVQKTLMAATKRSQDLKQSL